MSPDVVPPGFSVRVVTSLADSPDPSATVHALCLDSLGHADALAWAVRHPGPERFAAVGRLGGDLTPLAPHVSAVMGRPDPSLGHEGWRASAWSLFFVLRNPDWRDPVVDDTPGAVSREEFEEHLRAFAAGRSDDGSTC